MPLSLRPPGEDLVSKYIGYTPKANYGTRGAIALFQLLMKLLLVSIEVYSPVPTTDEASPCFNRSV